MKHKIGMQSVSYIFLWEFICYFDTSFFFLFNFLSELLLYIVAVAQMHCAMATRLTYVDMRALIIILAD